MGSRKQLKSTRSAADPPASSTSSAADQAACNNRSASQKPATKGGWATKTWPRGPKAAAVTEVARESISAAGNIASELVASTVSLDSPRTLRTNSIQLTKRAGASSRSLPADATTTKINIASNGSSSTVPDNSPLEEPSIPSSYADKTVEQDSLEDTAAGKETEPGDQPSPDTAQTGIATQVQGPNTQSSWFGWLGWGTSTADVTASRENTMGNGTDDGSKLESAPAESRQTSDSAPKPPETIEPEIAAAPQDVAPEAAEPASQTSQRRSWLQIWGGSSPNKAGDVPKKETPDDDSRNENGQQVIESVDSSAISQNSHPEERQQSEALQRSEPPKSSGWAFWSRETPKPDSTNSKKQEETGELILSRQVQPEAKTGDNVPQPDPQSTPSTPPATGVKDVFRSATPVKTGGNKTAKSNRAVVEDSLEPSSESNAVPAAVPVKVKSQEPTASKQLQSVLTNQLLPAFRETFALQESASWLQTLGRLLRYSKEPEIQHVSIMRDPPRPKRCLAIGVHGYFPAPYLRTVLGQPTGTSLKFSTMAAKAVHRWAESHSYHCNVEKISLEGEGRIADRVDLLWKLLLNWMEDIRKAEFIMFACHSQGVPVTIMLVAKLIAFGCLDAARVGICAMAGVNLGPFPDYKSRWIGGSAGELFDFANPTTKVSKDYEVALKTCLEFGVRITYVGSIDDQLVSLESSLFDPVSHPYIYRAVFVDGRVHTPSFLSHLVGLILKLRNLGIHDHGLIRELSTPLVGSLVGGEGHSRLHDEENIYYMAVEFALETTTVTKAPLHIKRHHLLSAPTNPYILPFALRGLLEEDYVRHELHQESVELLKQFDEWKPATKALKDVKFRLEGIRSKL